MAAGEHGESVAYFSDMEDGRADEHSFSLQKYLSFEDIERFRQVFKKASGHKLNSEKLRQTFESFHIYLSNEGYNTLFQKIAGRDNFCSWDNFLSHLIYEYQEADPNYQKQPLIPPIPDMPFIKKSTHKMPIVSLAFLYAVGGDEDDIGSLLTASRDGCIKFWSPDLILLKTCWSTSPNLRVAPTWLLAIEALSDVRIICVSATERELRFYDVTASNFHLRVVITDMPYAICAMNYTFTNINTKSRLLLGDMRGNIKVLEYFPKLRGPFQSKPGTAQVQLKWSEVVKGNFPKLDVMEFHNVHGELITQLYFWQKLGLILSASECHEVSETTTICPGLIITTLKNVRSTLHIPRGVTSFAVDDRNRMLVTGGPDGDIRLWDPFVPKTPSRTYMGHRAGIMFVFCQPTEKKIYSLDHKKILRVYSTSEHTLLQSYECLPTSIPFEKNLVAFYNKLKRELIVAERSLISIKCCPSIDTNVTDGTTHLQSISIVLFNKLYNNVVTCGADSYIIVWDPWSGKRTSLMKDAHTRTYYGETKKFGITAACFDPKNQFLLTGASDGTIKIWDYKNAVCTRNMTLIAMHEVYAAFWVPERILAIGWDRRIKEYPDVEGFEYSDSKNWACLHTDDIICAAMSGQILATGSYNGQLIFWKLESGQPYKQYDISDPDKFMKVQFSVREKEVKRKSFHIKDQKSRARLKSVGKSTESLSKAKVLDAPSTENLKSMLAMTYDAINAKDATGSVQAFLFLERRPMSRQHGSLFVALSNGLVQVYAHHHSGGYLGSFNAVHTKGDCVMVMATDKKNKFLFTGTAFGYIKTWLIMNYCIPEEEKVHVIMPKLRLQFIFLRKDRFAGRAKRKIKYQKEPMLVNSYRGHLRSLTSMVYIDQNRVLVTASHDCSCRLWTLGGKYLGTLGSPVLWHQVSPTERTNEDDISRVPADIKGVASSTTLKVLKGFYTLRIPGISSFSKARLEMEAQTHEQEKIEKETTDATKCVYGKPLTEPILGKHFELPERAHYHNQPVLDKTLPYIPVYAHLNVHQATAVQRPPTPDALKRTKKLDFMEHYNPNPKDK